MPTSNRTSTCQDCGASGPRTALGGVTLCDRCYNARVSDRTGWPRLPEPSPPEHVRTADGRSIPIGYRLLWTPSGLMSAEAEQRDVPPGDGYQLTVLGHTDEDPALVLRRLRSKVRQEVGRAYVERDHADAGWRIADTEVAGRIDGPQDPAQRWPSVVIDGRRFDWEAFGVMLATFEGWEFRLELGSEPETAVAEAPEPGRQEAGGEVIHLFGGRASSEHREEGERGDATSLASTPCIDDVLADFVADQEQRLAASTARRYARIIELLRTCLNDYGHQWLTGELSSRWRAAFDAGDAQAFTRLCGPEQLVEGYAEFLGYFMIRKVAASKQELADAGTVTKKLARWLGDRGYVETAAAEEATARAQAAARDLPRAGGLARHLAELAEQAELPHDPDEIGDEDWVEDQLPITAVERGRLWFDGVGPVAVPVAASELAEVGWDVTVVLARFDGAWHLVDVGFVYP